MVIIWTLISIYKIWNNSLLARQVPRSRSNNWRKLNRNNGIIHQLIVTIKVKYIAGQIPTRPPTQTCTHPHQNNTKDKNRNRNKK